MSSTRRTRALSADVAHLDLVERDRPFGPDLGVAVGARVPDLGDLRRDLVVGSAAAEERAEVGALRREEAGVELALGGEARAGAVLAERLRHGRDHPDLALAVQVAPALGDLAGIVRRGRLDRERLVHAAYDLARGHDVVHAPAVRVPDVHVFDEPEDVA